MSTSKRLYLILTIVLMFTLLSTSIYAGTETTITKNDITITSTKDVFYCEPVMNNDGCLIKADFIVESTKGNLYTEMSGDFKGFNVSIDYYRKEGQKLKNKEVISKKQKKSELTKLKNGKNTLSIDFWAKDDGYFDVSLDIYDNNNNFLYNVLLDPLFNTTFNATTPTLYLFNGTNQYSSVNQYYSATDITTGLSDNSSSTKYITSVAGSPVPISNLIIGYSFNDLDYYAGILHAYKKDLDAFLVGGDLVSVGDYYGINFDGISDYAVVPHNDILKGKSINFTYCVKFNNTNANDGYIVSKFSTQGGYRMKQKGDGRIECEWETNSNNIKATSSTSTDDGEIHIACCEVKTNTFNIWIDGVKEATQTKTRSYMNGTSGLYIGSGVGGINRFNGVISQIGIVNQSLTQTEFLYMNQTKSIGRFDGGVAISVFFNHTIEENETYFLYINSLSTDLYGMRIMTYKNSTHVNSSRYKDILVQSGYSYVPISDILYDGYNNPIRIWSLVGDFNDYIADIYLYEVGNDTIAPVITNCTVNNTNLTCGERFRMQCNIEDDIGVLNAYVVANLTFVPGGQVSQEEMNKVGDTWFLDKSYLYDTDDETIYIDWIKTNSTDLSGNVGNIYPNISIAFTCDICVENWTPIYIPQSSCQINNTYVTLLIYNDTNNCQEYDNVPEDNGTYIEVSCNYCTEDIQTEYGECLYNETLEEYRRTVEYIDDNYATCCAVTGLISDCGIEYLVNTSEDCERYDADINMSCDSNPTLKKKMYCLGVLPDKEEYKCYSYVRQGQNYLQTNPLYHDETDAFSLFNIDTETDTREYFTSQNGIVNFYYTNKDIISYTEYVLGLVCANDNSTYKSEMDINPVYDKYENIEARSVWAVGRMQMIVLMTIVLLFLIIGVLIFRDSLMR